MTEQLVTAAPRRAGQLLVRSVDGEATVLDPATSRTHALDRVHTAVFQAVDGIRGVTEIADVAGGLRGSPVDAVTVERTLAELRLEGLIEAGRPGHTRRSVLRAHRSHDDLLHSCS